MREVLEVELRPLEELLTLRPGDRRQRPPLHRVGPLAEPLEHPVDVELIVGGHRRELTPCARRARGPGR